MDKVPGKEKNTEKEGLVLLAAKNFLKTVVAAIMCFIIYISLSVIIIGMTTHPIGYTLYELNEAGEQVIVEEKLFDDTITKAPEPGEGQGVESIMSDPPQAAMIALNVISQTIMFIILAVFIVSAMREKGQRDLTQVKYRGARQDKLCGLKIGVLTIIPAFVAYLVLIFSKLTGLMPWYLFAYRYINICFLPIINSVSATAALSSEISWVALLVILLLHLYIPLVCHVSYTMGYKQIFLADKLMYKKSPKK